MVRSCYYWVTFWKTKAWSFIFNRATLSSFAIMEFKQKNIQLKEAGTSTYYLKTSVCLKMKFLSHFLGRKPPYKKYLLCLSWVFFVLKLVIFPFLVVVSVSYCICCSLFYMEITVRVWTSSHQDLDRFYLHLTVFFLYNTLSSSTAKEKVVIVVFRSNVERRPLFN